MLFERRHKPTIGKKLANFMWPKKGLKRAYKYIWYRVLRIGASPHSIALGFACGAFASFTPFLGLHFVIAAAIAFCLRSSLISSAFGTAVGNPLTFPFILPATYNFGTYLLGKETSSENSSHANVGEISTLFSDLYAGSGDAFEQLLSLIKPMLLGGVPMGLVCGLFCYVLVKPGVRAYQNARRRNLVDHIHDVGPHHMEPKRRAIRERGKH